MIKEIQEKDDIHPIIVANVLFSRWIRLSTITSYVSEAYSQKIEHYFIEVIAEARKNLPQLFK